MNLDRVVENIMHALHSSDGVIVYKTKALVGYCDISSDKAEKVLETPGAVIGVYKRGCNRAHIFEDITYCMATLKERAAVYRDRGMF